ncbi:Fc.00g031950.m01.CDS01 [Cosmosporella sp. VM-42]
MRPAVLLVQLALWASSTHAFFPYTPAWKGELEGSKRRTVSGRDSRSIRFDIKQRSGQTNRQSPRRAADEASRIATKYSRRRQLNVEDELVRRDNTFDVMKADESGKKMTSGIDQDGTDYSYFIEAELGSKGKKLYMLIDTGAGSSWVMGSSCTSKACGIHGTFGPDDSETLEITNKPFSIAYGSGNVNGELVKDTITVAGMSFNYQFGLAMTTSDQFIQFAFDGILGLAMNDGANENFLNTLDEANEIDNNIFCIALNRADDGSNEGEIRFGSTNSDKFTGEITYSDISHEDDWAIDIDDMGYDGKTAGVGGIVAYIDTGTSFIFGPEDLVQKLHAVIPGSASSDGTTYTIPCDSDKSFTISFSGVDYEVSAKDWISPKNNEGLCTSNIYGHEVVKGAWLLGDTFLKNVYTVFDKDKRRIGFANNAVTDGSNSTSSDYDTATKTSSGSDSTATSDSTKTAEDTGSSVTADLGLGKETVATDTATADAEKATETKDSSKDSSSPTNLLNVKYAFITCMITFFALLV